MEQDDERVVSRLTVLMYLNDDFIGGKTLLLLCTKVMMMILLWTTYKQGQFFGCLHFLVLQLQKPNALRLTHCPQTTMSLSEL
jgi:hypothetical protein